MNFFQLLVKATLTPRGQLITVSLFMFLGILFTILFGFAWAWFWFLIGLLFVLRYFLVGTVPAASFDLAMGDVAKAEKTLSYTWKPNWLKVGMKPLYYFQKGMIRLQTKRYTEGEQYINKAVELGLTPDDNLVAAYVNLSGIYLQKRARQQAKDYLHKAKKLKTQNPQLLKHIAEMERVIAQGRL